MKALEAIVAGVIAFTAVSYSSISQAQGSFAISGAGVTPCGKYLKPAPGAKEISDALIITWIQGYLSGSNTQRYAALKQEMRILPESESITAFVEKYCRENPLKTVYDATIRLDMSI